MKSGKTKNKHVGFRKEVEERLTTILGYPRVLGVLISTYVPTVADEVRFKFEQISWPACTVEEIGANEELFEIPRKDWFNEFSGYYSFRQPPLQSPRQLLPCSPGERSNYTAMANRIESILQIFPATQVHYLTAEINLSESRLRIAVYNQAIVFSFAIPLTLERAYTRFNQRLSLFLADVKQFVAPNDILVESCCAQLAGIMSRATASNRAYVATRQLFEWAESYIEHRDAKLFIGGYHNWKEWIHAEAIWKYANPRTREAIWRALEDLLDLFRQIQQIQTNTHLPSSSSF